MVTRQDFDDRFPTFEGDADTHFQAVKDVWPAYVDVEFDNNRELVLNLIAHLILIEDAGIAGRQTVQSRSAGGVSVGYQQGMELDDRDAFFSGTKYGQRVLRLLKKGRKGPVFV